MRQSSRFAAALLLLLSFFAATASAQSTAEPEGKPAFQWQPVVRPYEFWSPTLGFGAGGGIDAQHLFLSQDAGRLRLRAQQYGQAVELGWARQNPSVRLAPILLLTKGYRNLRENFYGVGPGALRDDRYKVNRVGASLDLRIGHTWGNRVWVQPRLGARIDRLVTFWEDGAVGPGPEPQLTALEEAGTVTGFEVGTDAGWSLGPGTGVQVHTTLRTHGDGQKQWVTGVAADWSRILSPSTRVYARLLLDRTNYRTEDLAYYLLPRLDDRLTPGWFRYRFYGNDRLVVGGTLIQRCLRILKSHDVEGFAAVSLSQVYEDIRRDFSPHVAAAPDRPSFSSGRIPLEPTLALGMQVVSLRSHNSIFRVAVGFSAEGFEGTGFRLTQNLADWDNALR